MGQSIADYFTKQFYAWEYRGRGWHLEEVPVQLEPPFAPYVRLNPYVPAVDDGKHHTLVSKIIERIKGKQQSKQQEETEAIEYEQLEVFEYSNNEPLVALQVKLPKERNITPERMKALIIMLSSNDVITSFEIFGNAASITIQFVCPQPAAYSAHTHIKAFFPELIVIESPLIDTIFSDNETIAVTDFGLREEFIRPLPTCKTFTIDPLTALFGVFDRLQAHQNGGIQILFCGAVNSWADSIIHSVTLKDGTSCFYDSPESPKLALEKIASPLFGVTVRSFGQGKTMQESVWVFEQVSQALLQACHGATNSLMPLPTETYDVTTRLNDIYLRRSHRLGMLLNADELLTLLHFPSASIQSAKLYAGIRKTKGVPAIAKNKPFTIGLNIHNGTTEPVSVDIDARLKHTHIIGATGTGKSTLIANMVAQDAAQGLGLILFDPHGDLVDGIIGQLPDNRLRDVVLLDPSDSEFPIGLNLLEAHNDIEKVILSSDLVASFRRLSTSWGDQMSAVFGNAILAMLESTQGGTLHDLRRFLVEKEYREAYLQTVADPSVTYYWQKEYPLLKTNSIGSILTRLDSFLRPRTIRNIIIQKKGLDFETLINTNKIILVKLSQGLIGIENSYLLGSLILSKIHQAAFARQNKQVRNPFFIYLDEFQNFITPSIKELLSGVRKYNVGLILCHQNIQQLQHESSDLVESVLGNTYTRIVFRVGETDARKLKDGFSGFDIADLQNLGRGEAIIRIEQPQFDCSLQTTMLSPVEKAVRLTKLTTVTETSRALYAKPRVEVEAMFTTTVSVDITDKDVPLPKRDVPKKEPVSTGTTTPPTPKQEEQRKEAKVPVEQESAENITAHKYLQTLIKRMAEVRGYTVTIEASLPNQSGSVDLVLTKEQKAMAIEICSTTNADWEMHNIAKCFDAGYTTVISVCGDLKQLERIKEKCNTGIADFNRKDAHFFTPDALFAFLDQQTMKVTATETTMKGYRVNVSYDDISAEEMGKKRTSVAQVVAQSLKKIKKK